MRFRALTLSSVLLIFFASAVIAAVWMNVVGSFSFKHFAEDRVGEFLKAKVSIANVKVGFLNRVALTGFNIERESQKESAYKVNIHEIVFKYDFVRLLTRNFSTPSTVILRSPEIAVPGELFPYDLFRNMNIGRGKNVFSRVELSDGYIRYHIPVLKTDAELHGVTGSFEAAGDGIFKIDFRAELRGFFDGNIRISGEVNALERSHRLLLDLKDVSVTSRFSVPFRNMTGQMRWEEDRLYFDDLSAMVHGWKAGLGGELLNFTKAPVLRIRWQAGKNQLSTHMAIEFDLGKNSVSGQVSNGKVTADIRGEIYQNGLAYEFKNLRYGEVYKGEGTLDFESGDYALDWEAEGRKFRLHSNLRGLDFRLRAELNHIKWLGLDMVAAVDFHLIPDESSMSDKLWKFHGVFDSDYFILEYTPLDDFRGSFEVTPYGIKNLLTSWGKIFSMRGSVSFVSGKPEASVTLRVDGYDLKDVKMLANKPLPKDIGGWLEGKIKADGPLDHLEMLGNFTVKQGHLGKVEYDVGIIQFRGFMPYLRLYESRVMKGRTSLTLEGALDFSRDNIFHGVQIRTPEKYAIWKGWEINTNQNEQNLEVDNAVLPKMVLSAGSAKTAGSYQETSQREEDNYLTVGPKFKF